MQTKQLDELLNVEASELQHDFYGNPIMETILGKDDDATDKEKLKAKQTPMPHEKVLKIKDEVRDLLAKGKKHRWIRRHIKRKYNISEY